MTPDPTNTGDTAGETVSTFDPPSGSPSTSGPPSTTGDTGASDTRDTQAGDAPVAILTDTPTVDEADTYPDPTDLKANRVYREGDIDFNSVSDTSHTAQGSRYPMTPERAEGLASTLEQEADLADAEADRKRDAAKAAREEADRIRSSVEGNDTSDSSDEDS